MTTTEPRLALGPAVAEPDPGLPIRPRLRHDALFAATGDGVLPEQSADEAPRTRFSAQLNYVDGAVRRFLGFRSTRVLVPGEGAALHNGLEAVTFAAAAGCPARAELRDRDI